MEIESILVGRIKEFKINNWSIELAKLTQIVFLIFKQSTLNHMTKMSQCLKHLSDDSS